MIEIGYALSSEEFPPQKLIENARRAEEVGFSFALISDHYHPWTNQQGQSPFVWSVLGGIAQMTQKIRVGTGGTCPLIRIHPAIIAQAVAAVASLMPGRFFLGVGTGENLNEHITGEKWPAYDIRAEMLEEAVEIIRLLWEGGGTQSYDGVYYTVENARVYSLPDELPPIMVAAGGKKSAQLAGRIGDGLITTADKEVVKAFTDAGSDKRPMIGQVAVCYAADDATARKTAYKWWPNAAIGGQISQELATPGLFEQAAKTVREEDVAESIICSSDPKHHLEAIQKYIDVGIESIYIHQLGQIRKVSSASISRGFCLNSGRARYAENITIE